jgi:hypothetical protein
MPQLDQIQQQIQSERITRDELEISMLSAFSDLKNSEKALEQAQKVGNSPKDIEKLKLSFENDKKGFQSKQKEFYGFRDGLNNSIKEFIVEPSPKVIEQLSDDSPFLLFPVRIETKFTKIESNNELWVRIFPDDISIQTHEKNLTVDEISAGHTFWTKVWESRNEADETIKNESKGAWNVLSNRYGANRSSWIKTQTKPTNWEENIKLIPDLIFPDLTSKTSAWTQGPRGVLLPERFVVMGFNQVGGQLAEVLRAEGNFIPDHLIVGPDPMQTESSFSRNLDGSVKVSPEMSWLLNFDEAVKIGMGLKIQITQNQAINGFDRIVVVGIRVGTNTEESRKLVELLLQNHHYTKGVSILPQGTPTNNTENTPSGFSSLDNANENSFENEANKPKFELVTDPELKPDGQRLAEALGIDPEAIFPISNYNFNDIGEAISMNKTIWNATLGSYMKDLMGEIFSDNYIEKTKQFFFQNVTGRGKIPVIRIGKQPYGILATSTFDEVLLDNEPFQRWQWTQNELGESSYLIDLQNVLNNLSKKWLEFSKKVSFTGDSKPSNDTLLDILGLQANSLEYRSRMATSDLLTYNYLSFKGLRRNGYTVNWRKMQANKTTIFNNFGLKFTHKPDEINLNDLTLSERTVLLDGPVIDQEPILPLSETKGLSFNYIEWLLNQEKSDTVLSGKIVNKKGESIPEPKALLYQLLKTSFLKSLAETSKKISQKTVPEIEKINFAESPLMNLNESSKRIVKEDLLTLSASSLGLGPANTHLGDYILTNNILIAPAFLASFNDLKKSLKVLKDLPTARLERIFAEHIDLCSYRLDAWQTGMVNQRLNNLRNRSSRFRGDEQTNVGTYIGAFSWVENLRPQLFGKTEISTDEKQKISDSLGRPINEKIYEDKTNAGFMMAPSLGQAVTSAVLRNAYISHADESKPNITATNLSSERVRTALFYFEGLRNGQDLGALLGYQFERGLHERYEGVELDEFIYVFRAKFPLLAGKLTNIEEGTSAEVIEARNVVNGYDLLQYVSKKQYPYDINGLPSIASNQPNIVKKAQSIILEVNHLADAFDAIGDLSLAESVYQVVEGNYDRARGIIQSLTEGKNPPEIQIVDTPRSGKGITQRVALTFDFNEINGWNPTLTPRAEANKWLNAWLKKILPNPKNIQCMVTGEMATSFINLKDLKLEPIDVISMIGDNIGDNSSELEKFMVHHFRTNNNISDDVINFFFRMDNPNIPPEKAIVFHPDKAESGKNTFEEVWFMLKSLKEVICKSRPLNAQDLILPSEGQNLKASDQQGFHATDHPELNLLDNVFNRIKTTHQVFSNLRESLKIVVDVAKVSFDNLISTPNSVYDSNTMNSELNLIREKIFPFFSYGISEAMPASLENFGTGNIKFTKIQTLVRQSENILKIVDKKLLIIQRDGLLNPLVLPADVKKHQEVVNQKMNEFVEAGKIILGDSFKIVPLFKLFNGSSLKTSLENADKIAKPLEIEEWLQSISRVRPLMQHLNHFATLSELYSQNPIAFEAVQLPFKINEKWIGLPFEDKLSEPEYLAILLNNIPKNTSQLQSGLLLDDWTEFIPASKETMGITFHYNRPNAVAPQTLLLAVSPTLKGAWNWEDLVKIVNETLDRAKMRAVEPDKIIQTDFATILPATMQSFAKSSRLISTYLANNSMNISKSI